MRILLLIAFNGSRYGGWQRQKNAVTVQGELEAALRKMAGQPITLYGAGRTDAGVSAKAFPAHFDYVGTVPPEKIYMVLNTMLPPDIRVQASRVVPDTFHARFSALGKRYVYRVWNAPAACPLHPFTMHIPQRLNLAAMRRYAIELTGTNDYTSFCASDPSQKSRAKPKTTVRTVSVIRLKKTGPLLEILVEGDGFLYNMVRILAGTLLEAGMGRRSLSGRETLAMRQRKSAGFTAEAQGLTLDEVFYRAFTE